MTEMKKLEKEDMQSSDIVKENIQQLKQLFPEVFSEDKINFEKLEEILGNYINQDEDHYNFTWHGKKKAARLAQTPSTGTLRPAKDESVDFDNTQNLFIEGDNLEVLKLLQKSYHRKVKMIYIDPPYNTGSDFVYEDDFRDGVKNYLEMTGQIDSEGKKLGTNSSSAGRYHTNWLNMMYPRLKLARNLLSSEGAIFISIDKNELNNLVGLMNEIFGEGCYKNIIIFKRGVKNVQAQFDTIDSLTIGHEYILFYAKDTNHRFKQFKIELEEAKEGSWNNHWRGTDRPTMRYNIFDIIPDSGQWRWGKDRSKNAIENYQKLLKEVGKTEDSITQNEIDKWWTKYVEEGEELDLLRLSKSGKPEHYIPPTDSKMGSDLWIDLSSRGSGELSSLFDKKSLFDNPKPLGLLKRMLSFITEPNKNHIVLDFFAGSGSTGHAVMDLNCEDGGDRKYILVQLPERTSEKSKAFKEGYNTISSLTQERLRRAGSALTIENPDYQGDLGFKVFKLDSSNIKRWDANFDNLKQNLIDAVDYIKQDRSNDDIVYEILLKYGLDLAVPIEIREIAGAKIYIIGFGALVICLDKNITMEVVNGICTLKTELSPEIMRVVFSDNGFKDDVIKTNAIATLKRAGIEDIKSL